MRLRTAAIGLLFVLSGCGSELIRDPYPGTPVHHGVAPGPQAIAENPTRDEKIHLHQLYADPRLDPIRDKVPLQLRADAVGPGYLRNHNRPTVQERSAIKAWLEVRERALQYQGGTRGPPSAQLIRTRTQVTRAITQLQSGKLTYAAFGMRIQEIDAQHKQAISEIHTKPSTPTSAPKAMSASR